jgi:hypothetical protein
MGPQKLDTDSDSHSGRQRVLGYWVLLLLGLGFIWPNNLQNMHANMPLKTVKYATKNALKN